MVDHLKPRRAGLIAQVIVLAGLLFIWLVGIHSFAGVLGAGLVLGVAGASFAVALPLASRWYPPEHQGTALGIAGAGNSGTVLAALFAPSLAVAFGWINVFGLALIPLVAAFIVYIIYAKDSPDRAAAQGLDGVSRRAAHRRRLVVHVLLRRHLRRLRRPRLIAHHLLQRRLRAQSRRPPAISPRPACSRDRWCGRSAARIADRIGGIRALTLMYIIAAIAITVVSFHLPQAWMALTAFVVGMLALGMGNGSVFQLVPQRFRSEIGVMTGLVGMTGGIGGFYLASSLGYSKQFTGSYQAGLLVFAALAVLALVGLTSVKTRWRTTWGAKLAVARI